IKPKERREKEEQKSRLLAFVIRPDRPVQPVDLKELAPIEGLIQEWREAAGIDPRPGKARAEFDGKAMNAAAQRLHAVLWQPLQEHLGQPRLLLISPDGPLARFPFAALPGKKSGSYLLEDLPIGYVVSARQLVELQQPF